MGPSSGLEPESPTYFVGATLRAYLPLLLRRHGGRDGDRTRDHEF